MGYYQGTGNKARGFKDNILSESLIGRNQIIYATEKYEQKEHSKQYGKLHAIDDSKL